MKLKWKLGLTTIISLLVTTLITAAFMQWVVSDAMEIRQGNALKMAALGTRHADNLDLYGEMEITATRIKDGVIVDASEEIIYIIGMPGNNESEQIARNEGSYFNVEVLADEEMYAYYLYDEPHDSVICVSQKTAPYKKNIITIVSVIFAGSIVSCIFCTIIALLLVTHIVKRLIQTSVIVEAISSKDFTKHFDNVPQSSKDEIIQLQNSMNKMVDDLSESIATVVEISDHVNETMTGVAEQNNNITISVGDISKAVEEIAGGAVSQATETATATANIEEMNANIETIKSSAHELTESAHAMRQTKDKVLDTLAEVQSITDSVADSVAHTSEQIMVTQESFATIQEAVEAINAISSQTNLLSLNASIEAARAGESGRGFAVVASEIRKLADDSAKSAAEVEDVIKNLSANFQRIIEEFASVNDNIAKQSSMSVVMKDDFEDLGQQVGKNILQIEEMQNMLDAIGAASEALTDIIVNLSAISEENSAGAEQTTASIQELESTITQINNQLQEVKDKTKNLQEKMDEFII